MHIILQIANKHSNKTCIPSALSRQVHVVYDYINQGLFLNIVTTRKMYSSEFSLKELFSVLMTK